MIVHSILYFNLIVILGHVKGGAKEIEDLSLEFDDQIYETIRLSHGENDFPETSEAGKSIAQPLFRSKSFNLKLLAGKAPAEPRNNAINPAGIRKKSAGAEPARRTSDFSNADESFGEEEIDMEESGNEKNWGQSGYEEKESGERVNKSGNEEEESGERVKQSGNEEEDSGERVKKSGNEEEDSGERVNKSGNKEEDSGESVKDSGNEEEDSGERVKESSKEDEDSGKEEDDGKGEEVSPEEEKEAEEEREYEEKRKNQLVGFQDEEPEPSAIDSRTGPGIPANFEDNMANGEGKFNKIGCGQPKTRHFGSRIVGGKAAKKSNWPWQVKLEICGSSCGGSIINRFWVVSAAHCFPRSSRRRWRRQCMLILTDMEHIRRYRNPGRCLYTMDRIISHPQYRKQTKFSFDIALIKSDKPFDFGRLTSPVCLPKRSARAGKSCYATGYGLTKGKKYGHGQASRLMELGMPIVPAWSCQKFHPKNYYGPTMICAGGETGKSGCQGDSGGPLVCKEENIWYLQGATSFGSMHCDGGPTVYTRISFLLDWIKATVDNDT